MTWRITGAGAAWRWLPSPGRAATGATSGGTSRCVARPAVRPEPSWRVACLALRRCARPLACAFVDTRPPPHWCWPVGYSSGGEALGAVTTLHRGGVFTWLSCQLQTAVNRKVLSTLKIWLLQPSIRIERRCALLCHRLALPDWTESVQLAGEPELST